MTVAWGPAALAPPNRTRTIGSTDNGQDPLDVHGSPDATLGGYLEVHNRPPAFEGSDGQPYTVSIELEKTPDLRAPYVGYLVYPRWAETGLGIVGHVQTPVLCQEAGKEAAERRLKDLSLERLKDLLDEAIAHQAGGDESVTEA